MSSHATTLQPRPAEEKVSPARQYSYWADNYTPGQAGSALKNRVEGLYLSLLMSARKPDDGYNFELLEVGPGQGAFANLLTSKGGRYTAIENSQAVARMFHDATGMDVLIGSFPRVEILGDRLFDVIYASHVIEHSETCSQAVTFVQGAHDRLRPGGLLMLNAPNFLSHKHLFYLHDYTHNFVTTPRRLVSLMRDCGFEVITRQETILWFKSAAIIALLKLVFAVTPNFVFDLIGRIFMPGSDIPCGAYGCSNVSVIGKKAEN